MDVALFLRGLIIGLSIAAPVGPIGVLCIRRTLAEGRAVGFASGLGAATADGLYGAVAALGLTAISNLLVSQQDWLRLVGGLFMLYLGLRTLLAQPAEEAAPARGHGLLGAYTSTLLLTLTNPLTILAFVAILAGLGVIENDGSALLLVAGVFAGSALWWLALSTVVGLLRRRIDRRALRWINWVSGTVIVVYGVLALLGLARSERAVQAELVVPPVDPAGFERVTGPLPLEFPADHGPHLDYQSEWWYYTGNLETVDGRHFGYQLTFFRRALLPPPVQPERTSDWAATQVYMAHLALSDVDGGEHQAWERFARGAAGLAGAGSPPLHVWLEDWQVSEVEAGVYRLQAAQDGVALDLQLVERRGPILHGDAGYSQKGPEAGNASIYVSQTRLETMGTVQVDGASYAVSGASWMDHEFSTSALGAGQVGWDWFALQLDDGSELMLFQLRRADGSVDPFSSGTLVSAGGAVRRLSNADFTVEVDERWRSPHSGATYPARWQVRVPSAGLELELLPYLADQEMNLSFTYWEGAVRVQGTRGGSGYVELTGYAGSMAEQF